MTAGINQIFSEMIQPMLMALAEAYRINGHFAEVGMIGPFTPVGTRASRELSRKRSDPPYRRSITVSTNRASITITVFYSQGDKKIFVGKVFSPERPGKYKKIDIDQIDSLLPKIINQLVDENLGLA